MYKMIILDLDGTLLDDYKEISQENIDMINKAYNEKGVISVIATGKPIYQAESIAKSVNKEFAKYIIASNGAIIKDTENDNYIEKQCLSKEEVLNLLDICEKYKVEYIINTTNLTLLENEFIATNGEKGANYTIKENMREHILNNNFDVLLFLILGTKDDIPNIESILKECRKEIEDNIPNIEMSLVSKYKLKKKEDEQEYVTYYIDVMKKGSTKKKAILKLADHLGIKQEEIIVMGDGGNDIPMFEVAGLKVAMGNAREELRQKADYITDDNNSSGVAKAIKKFIF